MRDELIERFYSEVYPKVFTSGCTGMGLRSTHLALERGLPKGEDFGTVLEVGAGGAYHVQFVNHDFETYIMQDIRDITVSNQDPRLVSIRGDATSLPLQDNSVDRLISSCLLHHLDRPDLALNEWRRVVRPGGLVSIFLSCDPGCLVRISRSVLVKPSAARAGFSEYDLLNALEHRNHFSSLRRMVLEAFREEEIRELRYPLGFLPSWNLNLFSIFQIRLDRRET